MFGPLTACLDKDVFPDADADGKYDFIFIIIAVNRSMSGLIPPGICRRRLRRLFRQR